MTPFCINIIATDLQCSVFHTFCNWGSLSQNRNFQSPNNTCCHSLHSQLPCKRQICIHQYTIPDTHYVKLFSLPASVFLHQVHGSRIHLQGASILIQNHIIYKFIEYFIEFKTLSILYFFWGFDIIPALHSLNLTMQHTRKISNNCIFPKFVIILDMIIVRILFTIFRHETNLKFQLGRYKVSV